MVLKFSGREELKSSVNARMKRPSVSCAEALKAAAQSRSMEERMVGFIVLVLKVKGKKGQGGNLPCPLSKQLFGLADNLGAYLVDEVRFAIVSHAPDVAKLEYDIVGAAFFGRVAYSHAFAESVDGG